MAYLIYKTTNLVNGKHYIGSHKGTHNDSYLGSGVALKAAIKKYGVENFKREVLFEADSAAEMYAKEAELIILGPDSYNLRLQNGRGGWDFVNKNGLSHGRFDSQIEFNRHHSPFVKGHQFGNIGAKRCKELHPNQDRKSTRL